MKTWKTFLPVLVFALLLASLVFGFGSFFKTYVIEPISLLFWAVWRLIGSIDQAIIWTVMILVYAVLVIILVSGGEKGLPQSAYRLPIVSLNRLEHWQKLIDEAALGASEKQNLRKSFLELLSQAGALTGGSEYARSTQITETFSAPVKRFLSPAAASGKLKRTSGGLFWAPKGLRRWLGKYINNQEEIIDEILQTLENELELDNGKQ